MMTTGVSRSSLLVAACAVLACSHVPAGPEYVAPTALLNARVASTDLWSGGDVTIISSSFKSVAAIPTVHLGSIAAVARRIDDSTIAATLPDTDGVFIAHVVADSFLPFDVSIEVHGFQSVRSGVPISGGVWSPPGTTMILAGSDVGMIEYELRTGTITRSWPDSVHSTSCAAGIGPSTRAGHFVAFGFAPGSSCNASQPRVWQYGTTLTGKDTLSRAGVTGIGRCTVWAEIGPTGRVCGGKGGILSSRCAAGTCTGDRNFFPRFNNMTGISIDPTGRLLLPDNQGPFLIDATTGDSLRPLIADLAAQVQVNDAAFSAGGDTVYAVADSFGQPIVQRLKAMNTATGATIATMALATGASGVAVDPARSFVYVYGPDAHGAPTVTVIDRRSFQVVGMLRGPASVLTGSPFTKHFMFVDVKGAALFVVATYGDIGVVNGRGVVLRFGLPRL